MPTDDHPGKKHECGCDVPTEKQARSPRWILTTTLPLLAAMVAVAFAITPLRKTLSRAHPRRPEPQRIHAELETALDQVYRAFEMEGEAATYDRIAQSVTDDATRDIYLEVRRSLLGEDGGRVSIDECPARRP